MTRSTSVARLCELLARLDQAEVSACRRMNAAIGSGGLLALFRIASRLGDGVLWYVLLAALGLGFGAAGRLALLQGAIAGVVGFLLYRNLKNVLVRERPYRTHAGITCAGRPLDRFSFPSGHTLHAVSFSLIAINAVPVLAWALVPVALLIALSRVVLGLHYPSDVLAGALLGAGIATAVMRLTG